MKLKQLYSEQISHLPESIQEVVIREAPHCQIVGIEKIFGVYGDFVDLGFENLGLNREEAKLIYDAFVGSGIVIPGEPNPSHRLRYLRTGTCSIEPIDGSETASLPPNWKQAVLILHSGNPVWIGKLVRPDQIFGLDVDQLVDVGDGFRLPQS